VESSSTKSLLLTLAIGLTGALTAAWLHLPAAALIGSSLLVSIASLFRVTVDIPGWLRNIAFTVIGCSLGSSITKDALADAIHWPISLFVLGVAVMAIMFACSWMLTRFFSQSAETAVLATSPGALAYSLGIAAGGIGDVRSILVIQNIRLLLVTTLLPFVLDNFGFELGKANSAAISGGSGTIVVILISLGVGLSISRWKIPASFLIVGMVLSGIGHYLGLVIGRPPSSFIFMGFAITGSMVGARFSSIPLRDLKKLLLASFSVFVVSGLLALVFAVPVAKILNLPYGQVFVAYAPGGVEAMAAMAIALGYDPAFVATHHLFRIFLLFLFLPASLRIVKKIRRRQWVS